MVLRLLLLQYTLLCFVMTTVAGANTGHVEGTSAAAGEEGDRSPGGAGLSASELRVMSSAFKLPDDFVKGRWDTKLPAALAKAKANADDKSEDDVALILAKAVATIGTRAGSHFDDIPALLKAEVAKLEKSDNRFSELLKRLYWMTEVVNPGEQLPFEKGAAFLKFQKAFLDAIEKVKEDTRQFYADLDAAEKGEGSKREEAKERLRKRDPGMMIAFMKNMADKGQSDLANRLGNAVAFNESGRNFIQASIKGGRTAEIQIHDGDAVGALKKFEAQNPTIKLSDLTFAQTKLTRPADIKVEGPKKGETIKPVKETREELPPRKDPDIKPERPADNGLETKRAAAFAILKAKCSRCHGPDGDSGKFLEADGKPKADTSARAKRISARIHKTDDDVMPPPGEAEGTLSTEQKAAIQAWVTAMEAAGK